MGRKVHIIVYEALKGPVPNGLELDHLCHNADLSCPGGAVCEHRRCWEITHLEAVVHQVNSDRGRGGQWLAELNWAKTHCPHGHEYTPENTYEFDGTRKCRECAKLDQRKRRKEAGAGTAPKDRTECPEGHEYTPENTITTKEGWRKCRTCTNDKQNQRRKDKQDGKGL